MKTERQEQKIQRNLGERREAEHLATIILSAPKDKDARLRYFRLLLLRADADTGQRSKGESEFFDAIIRFIGK